jgi:hypothetical protein
MERLLNWVADRTSQRTSALVADGQPRARLRFLAPVLLIPAVVLGACIVTQQNAAIANVDAPQLYEPLSRNTVDVLGELRLTDRQASFSVLDGRLELQLDEAISRDLTMDVRSPAHAYRVLNPEEFFERNRGKNGFCSAPVKWFVTYKILDPYLHRVVRVLLFEGDDLYRYRNGSDLCSEDSYVLRTANQRRKP